MQPHHDRRDHDRRAPPLPPADVEATFHFTGLNGFPSTCGLRIYYRDRQTPLVLLTELHDNPGTSVTNAVELLAEQVTGDYDLPTDAVWVEHYPPDKRVPQGRYARILLTYLDAGRYLCGGWKHLEEDSLRRMIGRGYEQ